MINLCLKTLCIKTLNIEKINNILVKVPMPQTSSALMQTKLLVTDVDILYKESDALAVKVLDTVPLSSISGNFSTIAWSDPVHGVSSTSYLSYDYNMKSIYLLLSVFLALSFYLMIALFIKAFKYGDIKLKY